VGIIEIAHSEKIIRKSRRTEGKNLRVMVGPQASAWGVVHSKFLRAASPIFFIFYARAQFLRHFLLSKSGKLIYFFSLISSKIFS